VAKGKLRERAFAISNRHGRAAVASRTICLALELQSQYVGVGGGGKAMQQRAFPRDYGTLLYDICSLNSGQSSITSLFHIRPT
jgi:hypothetical protein